MKRQFFPESLSKARTTSLKLSFGDMPFQTQLSLELELAKIFPIRGALAYSADQLVNLVRALKKDRSDFLVEENLASIFG